MTTNACRDRRPEFEVLVSDDGESNAGLVEDNSASHQHDFEIGIAQSSIDPLPVTKVNFVASAGTSIQKFFRPGVSRRKCPI